MAFQISPGVVTNEVDLTSGVPAVGTTAGAFAGIFKWGPVDLPVQVANETKLVEFFGTPDNSTAVSFFTCANFLSYGNNLWVVRAGNGLNTNTAISNASSNVLIKNDEVYFNNYYTSNSATLGPWAARYPGSMGNSLRVSVWANSNTTHFASWPYASYFSGAPGTSDYVAALGGANDEMHIVVIDEDGLFSGTANSVLEVYPFVSKASDAKDSVGNSNYFRNVIYTKSRYVLSTDYPDAANTGGTWGQTAAGRTFAQIANAASLYAVSLTNGTDGVPTSGNVQSSYAIFANPKRLDVSLIMTGNHDAATQLYVINSVAEARKDCVAFVSPAFANTQTSTPETDIVNYRKNALSNVSTSYAIMDGNWKYQYDKYNDVYRWLPLNGDIAGLCVAIDEARAPWFSPGNIDAGNIKNVTKLAYYISGTATRDTLYSNGVNPVESMPGQGTKLMGDKTMLSKPSAFDRINVRRLFVVLKKTISIAAETMLFQQNDEFTRASFKSMVEPFLRTVKGGRGITDFRVVCDATNNTPEVIDRNEFIGDIYVKPTRSINFIKLNFVATRTGVEFDEVVGRF